MKEDYLWDKTGKDPEIQRLENALRMFRYEETAPPALPAKIIPFERNTPRKFFRLAFAFAACAAFAVFSLGVWLQISSEKIEVAKDSTETTAPLVSKKVSDEIADEKPDDLPNNLVIKKVEVPRQSAEQKIIKVRKLVPASVRQNKPIAQNIQVEKPPVKLTKDEKYAYDQLMLALSITSSKLKLVEEKIYGVEETKTILENER
ncbi:MAG: hypothetical protein H0W45_03610 [Acidobacteria bacterium]|nr:hypothetical protein [Acidobacteriota bacterium]